MLTSPAKLETLVAMALEEEGEEGEEEAEEEAEEPPASERAAAAIGGQLDAKLGQQVDHVGAVVDVVHQLPPVFGDPQWRSRRAALS